MNRAIFLDRDGVINYDGFPFPYKFDDLKLYPKVPETIAYLKSLGYLVIVITNQPCVSRGVMTEEEVEIIHAMLSGELRIQNENAIIDGFYFCPHHPASKDIKYKINCFCRKPWPGLLLKAKDDFNIDLKKSLIVGDRVTDVIAGNLVGCQTILCKTGMEHAKRIESECSASEMEEYINFEINEISDLMSPHIFHKLICK